MTTHQILVAAKGYLLNHGWAREFGSHGGPRCLMGGVASACGGDWYEGDDLRVAIAAEAKLERVIGRSVPFWNDAPERTFDDVIAALDAAILQTAPKDTPEPSPSVIRVFA